MIRLILLVFLPLVGCSKSRDYEAERVARITESLGGLGHVQVEVVKVPAGPFKIYKPNSHYYRVIQDKKIIYVEVYPSNWSALTVAAGGDIVERLAYWEEVKLPIIGKTYRKITK